jgi:hypothetical protein
MNRSLLHVFVFFSGFFLNQYVLQWIFIKLIQPCQHHRQQRQQEQQQVLLPQQEPTQNTTAIRNINTQRHRRNTVDISILDSSNEANLKTLGINQDHKEQSILQNDVHQMNVVDRETDLTTHQICHAVAREFNKHFSGQQEVSYPYMPNAISIWGHYTSLIFESSRFVNDTNDIFHAFIIELMKFMTPSRLAVSLKTLPFSNWDQVDKIIHILFERCLYVRKNVNNNDQGNENPSQHVPRKLYIAVYGGSVTFGENCPYSPIDTESTERRDQFQDMTDEQCSWPARLEYFLNNLLLGKDYNKQTKNINSQADIGIITIQKFNADKPDDGARKPDIIINAYSTDYYKELLSMLKDDIPTNPEEEWLFEKLQAFVRVFLTETEEYQDPTCRNLRLKIRPLVMLYNDVNNRISLDFSHNMISNYYGLGYMSYYDAIQDLVFPDTSETWFSPPQGVGT